MYNRWRTNVVTSKRKRKKLEKLNMRNQYMEKLQPLCLLVFYLIVLTFTNIIKQIT